jgi:hypothetical protein
MDPKNKANKHDSYSLNEKGYRTTKQRPHRVYESLIQASTELGVLQNKDFEYLHWDKLKLLPSMKGKTALELMHEGKSPHHIHVDAKDFVPDGCGPNRIFHIPSNTHINVLDEADRNTMPVRTADDRRNIEEKFEHYREFIKRDPTTKEAAYTKHYGFQQCFVRFVTTDESNLQWMMWVFEKKYGKDYNFLFATWPDWFYKVAYPKGEHETKMFRIPYKRVGYPDYYLNRFYEM